ncbi:MAG: hypothetical protein ACRDD1_18140 [Planctomycetia bacterium]
MNPLFPVARGQPVDIPADAWNAFIESAKRDRSTRPQQGGAGFRQRSQQNLRAQAKNVIGGPEVALARGDVGAFRSGDMPNTTDFTDPFEINEAGLFVIRRPSASQPKTKAICIATEPIATSKYGEVIVSGVAVCNVNKVSVDDEYAVLEAGRVDRLISSAYGNAYILDSESGTGVKQAVVMLGASSRRRDVFVRNTTQQTNTTTTFANSGITAKLDAGRYIFNAVFFSDASVLGGYKFDFGAIPSIPQEAVLLVTEQGTGIIQASTAVASFAGYNTANSRICVQLSGYAEVSDINVQVTPRFAMNNAAGTNITFRAGSYMSFQQMDFFA